MEADVRPQTDEPATVQSSVPSSTDQHGLVFEAISSYPFHSDPEYQAGLASILGHPETPATEQEINENGELVLQAKCFYFTRFAATILPWKANDGSNNHTLTTYQHRKHNLPSIDPAAFSNWLHHSSQLQSQDTSIPTVTFETTSALSPTAKPFEPSSTSTPPRSSDTNTPSTSVPPTNTAPSVSQTIPPQEPPYPTSFAAIVDLITRNIPVPGIEDIPSTILEPGSSKIDKTPRRKKPWEAAGVGENEERQAEEGEDKKQEETPKTDVNGHKMTGQGVVKILQPNAIPDSGLLAKD